MMTKDTVQGASFYSNGEYLGALLPPGLFPNPSSEDAMLMAFSFKHGRKIATIPVKQKHAPETGTLFPQQPTTHKCNNLSLSLSLSLSLFLSLSLSLSLSL